MTIEFPEITVNTQVKVGNDVLEGLVVHIFEDGGYGSFEIVGYEGDVPEDDEWPKYVRAALSYGCSVLVKDKYGDEPDTYKINLATLSSGLQVMADRYPHIFTDVMDDSCDVLTSNSLAQCAVYGKIVYG